MYSTFLFNLRYLLLYCWLLFFVLEVNGYINGNIVLIAFINGNIVLITFGNGNIDKL